MPVGYAGLRRLNPEASTLHRGRWRPILRRGWVPKVVQKRRHSLEPLAWERGRVRSLGSGPCLAAALAQNLVSVWYEALAHQGGGAAGAGEAAVVPVSVFEGHILASTGSCGLATAPTCDRALAAAALGCKEFSKTGHAVGIIVPRCELLSCQGGLAPSADQALSMPGLISICHSTLGQRLAAAGTPGSELVLIARHAVVSALVRHEGAGA